jgi:aromatic-L-amino-acid decarboxylase
MFITWQPRGMLDPIPFPQPSKNVSQLTICQNSCLFVRNRLDLTRALDVTPTYLRNPYSETGVVTDYRNWQIPLGRRFRALKIWFVIRSYGLSGLKAHIRKGVELGNIFEGLVRGRGDLFEIVTEPGFGLTVLRVRGLVDGVNGNGDVDAAGQHTNGHTNGTSSIPKPDPASTAITREVYETINARGEIYLTSSVVAGVYVIRQVCGNPMAEEKYVRRAFEILVEVTEEVKSKGLKN